MLAKENGSTTSSTRKVPLSKPSGKVQKTKVVSKANIKSGRRARAGQAPRRRSGSHPARAGGPLGARRSTSPVLTEQHLDSEVDEEPVRDENGPIRIPTGGRDPVPVTETDVTSMGRFDTTRHPLLPFQPVHVPPGVPYNLRLPSSTPCMTPTKLGADDEGSGGSREAPDRGGRHGGPTEIPERGGATHQRVLLPCQALNSSEEVRSTNPPPAPDPGPHLAPGSIHFQPCPSTGRVIITSHGKGVNSSSQGQGVVPFMKTGPNPGTNPSQAPLQYSMYTDSDFSGTAAHLAGSHPSKYPGTKVTGTHLPQYPRTQVTGTQEGQYLTPQDTGTQVSKQLGTQYSGTHLSQYQGTNVLRSQSQNPGTSVPGSQSQNPRTSVPGSQSQYPGNQDLYKTFPSFGKDSENLYTTINTPQTGFYITQTETNTTPMGTNATHLLYMNSVPSDQAQSGDQAQNMDIKQTLVSQDRQQTDKQVDRQTAVQTDGCKHCENCPNAVPVSPKSSSQSIQGSAKVTKNKSKSSSKGTATKPTQHNKKVQCNSETKKKPLAAKTKKKEVREVSGERVTNQPAGDPGIPAEGKTTREAQSPQRAPPLSASSPQRVPQVSVSQAKTNLQTLRYLMRELKAVVGLNNDVEVDRLTRDIESTVAMFVPGMGVFDWQTEIDLAMQPLRSENAQLRRRLRIASQQMKDQSEALENAEKPDPSFQVVHLEMQNKLLEKKHSDERQAKERAKEQVRHLQAALETLNNEKLNMLQIMNSKDTEVLSSQQDLVNQVNSLRSSLDKAELEKSRLTRQLGSGEGEIQMLKISLQQRDEEIEKLQHLVRNLQMSMTRLLHDLQGSQPMTSLSSGLQKIEEMIEESMNGDQVPESRQTQLANQTSAFTSPAKRVLNFDLPPSRQEVFTEPKIHSPIKQYAHHAPGHMTAPGHITSPSRRSHDLKLADTSPDMNSSRGTDYLLPYGMSPIGTRHSLGRKYTPGGGPTAFTMTNKSPGGTAMTVKDFLQPLASKLTPQKTYSTSLPASGGNKPSSGGNNPPRGGYHPPNEGDNPTREGHHTVSEKLDPFNIPGVVPLPEDAAQSQQGELSLTQLPLGEDQDSTLVEEEEDRSTPRDRPREALSGSHTASTSSPARDNYHSGYHSNNYLGNPYPTDSERTPGRSSSERHSFLSSAFQGTELDTSLSTIPDLGDPGGNRGDLSSVGTVTSSSSLASVSSTDDQAFQEGLASLDANIARIQQQLRDSLSNSQ